MTMNGLLGSFNSEGPIGLRLNTAGVPVGTVQTVFYLKFGEDGSFHRTIVAGGPIVTGILITRGKYRLERDRLILYELREDWNPQGHDRNPPYKNKEVKDQLHRLEVEDRGIRLFEIENDVVSPLGYFFFRVDQQ